MIGTLYQYYHVILIIQGFALFHAYRNGQFQKWYWIIIFLPLIGSIIYLYDNFYNRKNIDNLGEGVKKLLNSNYEVQQFERELSRADTILNKLNLANAYLKNDQNQKALDLYDQCMIGTYANDPNLYMKKLRAYYQLNRYDHAVAMGDKLHDFPQFQQSEEKIAYADALDKLGHHDRAETMYNSTNHINCNYKHRLAYLKFLVNKNKIDEAKKLHDILSNEIRLMTSYELKSNPAVREIKQIKI